MYELAQENVNVELEALDVVPESANASSVQLLDNQLQNYVLLREQ